MKKLALILVLISTMLTVTTQSQTALPTTRITSADFTYVGSFLLPEPSGGPIGGNPDGNSFNGGAEGMLFNPTNSTLFALGSRSIPVTTVAEINIPAIRQSSTVSGLARATYRQLHTDIFRGLKAQIGCGGPMGGLLLAGSDLIGAAYCYYDAAGVQVGSHFRASQDFTVNNAIGPLRTTGPVGFVSGYMSSIPTEWRTALGGDSLTGNCCIPIITRTSWGPAVSSFNVADVGRVNPIPTTALVGYPNGHPLEGDANCMATGELFNCNTAVAAVHMVSGTASVLFFGTQGTGDTCYGMGTSNPALHDTPHPEGESYCYDPAGGSKGAHAYPYRMQVWAYDANDFVRVRNGQLQQWQVRPYQVWGFDLPHTGLAKNIMGVAFDAATRRFFISAGTMNDADHYRPIVHVVQLGQGGTVPPPPPPPSDTTAPVVSITAPLQGQILTGPATFSATGMDNVGVTSVDVVLDGAVVPMTTPLTLPLSFPFNSADLADGNHTLQLRARDAAGNVGVSQSVSFSVLNASAPPPPPPPPVLPTITATLETTQCRLTVPAFTGTPDGTTGWRVQIRRGSVNHGTSDATSPYGPKTALVSRGEYVVTALWTKTGAANVVQNVGTFVCE